MYVVHIRWLPWGPKIRVRTFRLGVDSLQFLPFDGDEFGVLFGLFLVLLLVPLVLLLLPVLVLLIELAILAAVIAVLLLLRFAFGAPWIVDVRDVRTGERTSFKVEGFARAKQVARTWSTPSNGVRCGPLHQARRWPESRCPHPGT